MVKKNGFQQERYVAETGLGAAINRKTLWSFKLPINQRNVELQREPIVQAVAGDELSDRAIFILTGRVRDLAAVDLNGSEMGELLAHGRIPALGPWKQRRRRFHCRHRFQLRSVATAQVTGPAR
jgi:hypothetical protein